MMQQREHIVWHTDGKPASSPITVSNFVGTAMVAALQAISTHPRAEAVTSAWAMEFQQRFCDELCGNLAKSKGGDALMMLKRATHHAEHAFVVADDMFELSGDDDSDHLRVHFQHCLQARLRERNMIQARQPQRSQGAAPFSQHLVCRSASNQAHSFSEPPMLRTHVHAALPAPAGLQQELQVSAPQPDGANAAGGAGRASEPPGRQAGDTLAAPPPFGSSTAGLQVDQAAPLQGDAQAAPAAATGAQPLAATNAMQHGAPAPGGWLEQTVGPMPYVAQAIAQPGALPGQAGHASSRPAAAAASGQAGVAQHTGRAQAEAPQAQVQAADAPVADVLQHHATAAAAESVKQPLPAADAAAGGVAQPQGAATSDAHALVPGTAGAASTDAAQARAAALPAAELPQPDQAAAEQPQQRAASADAAALPEAEPSTGAQAAASTEVAAPTGARKGQKRAVKRRAASAGQHSAPADAPTDPKPTTAQQRPRKVAEREVAQLANGAGPSVDTQGRRRTRSQGPVAAAAGSGAPNISDNYGCNAPAGCCCAFTQCPL